ncbi:MULTISPECIES: DUF3168 domain-containing protein [Sphingomonas]|uniref:tail completion protein gp17 n=1 Tax=Sphingomonas TaxID=13687 RepID=UPI00280B98E3|nr:DUF3168 domain-containing protein [Sphingomonas sp. GV3]
MNGAGEALRAAMLRQLAPLRVFDAPPVRAALPFAVVGEPVLAAIDAAALSGRGGTIVIAAEDEGEAPDRLRRLLAGVEAAVDAMPTDLGAGGWRLASVALSRSRIVGKGRRWTGMTEFAVRLYRANG